MNTTSTLSSPIRFTRSSSRHVLKPKSLFYFKLRTCLVRRIFYLSSPLSLSLFPGNASQSYAWSDIHTHPHEEDTRTLNEKRPRDRLSHCTIQARRERALLSRYPLTTSVSICLLCKSSLTSTDVDGGNDDGNSSGTTPSTAVSLAKRTRLRAVSHCLPTRATRRKA